MKKLVVALVGMGFLSAAFAATTCTWIGTSGNWSDQGNWQDGVKPTSGAGDTVVLTCTSPGAVISNDMGEVSIANLTFETPNAVTLVGDPIRLTGTIMTHTASVIGNDLHLDGDCNLNAGEKTYGGDYRPTFNGALTIADAKKLYVFGNSGANFNGSITGPNGYIYFGPRTATYRWDSGSYNFNGPVVIKEFQHHDYGSSNAYFYNSGNHWEKITHRYGSSYYFYNDSMPHEAVVDFISSGERRSAYRGFFFYGDMTLNRIECTGTCPVVDYGEQDKRQFNWFRNNDTKAITMTLKATASAKTSCAIRMNTHDINFVYDPLGDYTQEFLESFFNSRTSITVKGGTLKFTGDTLAQSIVTLDILDGATFDLDVTNSEALKNVMSVRLGKNARLRIGAGAVTPFAKKPTVTMDYGAKLVIAEGASVEIGNCTAPNGLIQPVGAYTGSGASGTTASWVEGGGTVNVATSSGDYVFWKSAVDGVWKDAAKWAGDAVPAAGRYVAIARDGASYAVTVDEPPAQPTGLIVINDGADKTSTLKVAAPMTVDVTAEKPLNVGAGGRIEVVEGGSLKLAANSLQTDALNIKNGGELEIAGGEVDVPYLPGRFNIFGREGREGIFRISSGTCTVTSVSSLGRFCLGDGGRFAMTGGVFFCPGYTSYYRTFEFVGGTLDLSGDAQFWTAVARTPYQGCGTISLSGNAQFSTHRTRSDAWQSRVYFEPQTATDVLAINVTDHAKYDLAGAIQTDFGGQKGGTVIARFASDQRQYLGAWGYVGVGNSKAVATLEDGSLVTGTYGLCIGGQGDQERILEPFHSEGKLIMTGGTLDVYADTAAQPGKSPHYGFLIGFLPIYTNDTLAGSTATGTFELSGGVVTNTYGFTQIGFGAAKGRVIQTGGFFGTSNNKPMAIGAYSGEGEWVVSNGMAWVRGQVYLGGVVSDDFDRPADESFPEGIPGSKGRLEISGGTFSCYQLYAGTARGKGSAVIEVGLAGELKTWRAAKTAYALELGNAKLVRRIGDCGTGRFLVDGDVLITESASLEIDAGALANQDAGKFTLLEYTGERTGDFDASRIEMKGFTNNAEWKLRWVGKRLRCTHIQGLTVIVR